MNIFKKIKNWFVFRDVANRWKKLPPKSVCDICGRDSLAAIGGYREGCPGCTAYVEGRFTNAGISREKLWRKVNRDLKA